MFIRLLILTLLFVATGLPGFAAPVLIPNGDFSLSSTVPPADDPAPFWFLDSTDPNIFFVDNFNSHSGNQSAHLGNLSDHSLSQILTTIAGESYTVSFWLANSATSTINAFSVYFDSVQMTMNPFASTELLDAAPFAYQQVSFTGMATASSTQLDFIFNNEDGFWSLDDVEIDLVAAPGAPELNHSEALLPLLLIVGFVVAQGRRRPTGIAV